jgi:hypothetical protein
VGAYHGERLLGRVAILWCRSTSQTLDGLWPVSSEMCVVAKPTLRYRSMTRPELRGAGWGKHRVDPERRERPQLGEPLPDGSTSPGAHLVALAADADDCPPSVELHFDGPVAEPGVRSTAGRQHRRRERKHRPQDVAAEWSAFQPDVALGLEVAVLFSVVVSL